MTWSPEPPTVAGWYWGRFNVNGDYETKAIASVTVDERGTWAAVDRVGSSGAWRLRGPSEHTLWGPRIPSAEKLVAMEKCVGMIRGLHLGLHGSGKADQMALFRIFLEETYTALTKLAEIRGEVGP